MAIDLFFVLSGFLISGLLFQEAKKTGTISVSRFLVRRGFKIYPPFWVMLIGTMIGLWCIGSPISLRTLLIELCFVQNYTLGPPPTYVSSFWGVTWSLGVEEHFYFALAGVFYLLKRRAGPNGKINFDILPKLFVWVAAGCLLARFLTWAFIPFTPQTMIWYQRATHVRVDAIFFGVLLSYFWHNRWDEAFKAKLMSQRWLFLLGAAALLFPAIWLDSDWFRIFGYNFTYLGSGYLLVALLSLDRTPSGIILRSMASLGRHSYSVYLWHMLAAAWILAPHRHQSSSYVGLDDEFDHLLFSLLDGRHDDVAARGISDVAGAR